MSVSKSDNPAWRIKDFKYNFLSLISRPLSPAPEDNCTPYPYPTPLTTTIIITILIIVVVVVLVVVIIIIVTTS